MRGELPEGWSIAPLDSLCTKVRGVSYKREEASSAPRDGYLPILRANNIEDDRLRFSDLVWVPAGRITNQQKLRKDDVVVAMSSGSKSVVGKAAQVSGDWDGAFGAFCGVLRPRRELCGRYLGLFLRTREYRTRISDLAAGTNINNLKNEHFAQIEVPVAPLPEQRRIVAKLEELLGKVDACRKRLDRVPLVLKRFRQSVLSAACSGRLTAGWRNANPDAKPASAAIGLMLKRKGEAQVRRGVPESVPKSDVVAVWDLPETWSCYSAADLLRSGAFVDLKDGNHGANHPRVDEFTKQGMSFITAAQVNSFRIDYDGAYKLSGEPLARIHVGLARPGDVIYTHKGSVGRVAIADRECILSPQTTYYRVAPEVFASGFLMLFLASPFFSAQVDIVKEQTTRDFVPISEQYSLFHRIPPLAEQREIVSRVEGLFGLADQLEARYVKAQAQVDRLTPSLLSGAFRGELVPTEAERARAEGRDYESAAVLLERIRAAETSDRSAPTRRRSRPTRPSTTVTFKRAPEAKGEEPKTPALSQTPKGKRRGSEEST